MKRCRFIHTLLVLLAIGFSSCDKKEKGCTDPKASNYDITADEDDGSCVIIDAVEGEYLMFGNKNAVSSPGSIINVQDTLVVKATVSPRYRITGMDACGEVVIEVGQNSWLQISNTCGLDNWQSQFFGQEFNSLTFNVVENGITYRYNCQLYKL